MTTSRVAWLAPALSVALGGATIVLQALTPAEALPPEDRVDVPDVLFALSFVVYAAVGGLIAARHPRNAVGWLFCGVGVALPATGLLYAYATYGLVGTSNGLPADELAAWAFAWSGDSLLALIVLLLLLFPSGTFLSRRWRTIGMATIAITVVSVVATAVEPGPLHNFDTVVNPLGIEEAEDVLGVLAALASVGFTLAFGAAGLSVVVRYRRVGPIERQQLKWLAAAVAFSVAMVLLLTLLEATTNANRGLAELVTSLVAFMAVAPIPVAVGFAMLRHRLYDVDVVINRTLVYGALTAALVGAYVGSILLLQLALSPLTEDSDLAIAGSTLAVAGLVRPLRAHIQAIVDRRFFRRRYDAARTLEAFGTRLRDQVELDSLSVELRAVVADTMQPAHVSLWLREAGR
jgi:hypothetical protein